MTSVTASYKAALAIALGLSATFSQTYAMGIKNSKIKENNIHGRPLKLKLSEGTDSYKNLLEQDSTQKFKLIRRSTIELPPTFDFSGEIDHIHTQGDLGSCAPQCLTLVLEYCLKKLNTQMTLSSLFVYYNERKLNKTILEDVGSSLSDTIQSIYQYGACQELTWPYVDDNLSFKQKPSAEAYNEPRIIFKEIVLTHIHLSNEIDLIKHTLFLKIPIICGIRIYPSFQTDKVEKTGIITMPSRREEPIGSHAITFMGYNDKTRLIKFANSWGTRGETMDSVIYPTTTLLIPQTINPPIHIQMKFGQLP